METLAAFVTGFLVTFHFVRGHLRKSADADAREEGRSRARAGEDRAVPPLRKAHPTRLRVSMADWSPVPVESHGHPQAPLHEPLDGQYDVIVVGAGPAGLSASLSAQQHCLRYLTIEQGEVASTIKHYPRHKFLMAEPVEMPLYGSLYIGDGAKESLLAIWETIIANTGVRIQTNERVTDLRRASPGGSFIVESSKGRYMARDVVLALGKRGTPRRLGVQKTGNVPSRPAAGDRLL